MLKSERLQHITRIVNEKGVVNVTDIMNALNVSDMTVRRDLDELEKSGKLIRIRGGAQSLNYNLDFELTHEEKSVVKMEEKTEIAVLRLPPSIRERPSISDRERPSNCSPS